MSDEQKPDVRAAQEAAFLAVNTAEYRTKLAEEHAKVGRDKVILLNGRAEREREADATFDLGEWDFGEDNEEIPPRGWLQGNLLCRQFLSSIVGEGAVGKTALEMVLALSLATGRNLLAEHVFQRCNVLLVCFEDGKNELRRRLTAAMLHYDISKAHIKGRLFITAISRSDAKIAAMENGKIIGGKLGGALDRAIQRRSVDVVFLDPFIKTHSVNENDNSAIDCVVEMLVELMVRHNCSICTPHHTRKGPADPGNADTGRGASAFKDAGRLAYTLNKMTASEAKLFGLKAEDADPVVRLDNAKVNLAPASTHAGLN